MPRDDITELAEKIRSHPGFAKASRRYAAEYPQWRDQLGVLNKVIANTARLRILENLVYLHFVKADVEHGATFERLAELSGFTDQVGARAVRTVLRLAQTAGLVVSGRDAEDGRLRVYRPTDALVGYARDYAEMTLRPLDTVFPHLRICERLRSDPAYYFKILSAFGRVYLDMGLKTPRTNDAFRDLMRLEGAAPVLTVVLDCSFNARDIPAASEFSRRFHVSQSQVRALLKAVEAQGLVRTGPRGRLLDAEPLATTLFGAYARFLAFAAKNAFGVAPLGTA